MSENTTEENTATVSLKGEFLDGDLLKLSALVQDSKKEVLGVAFHLKYDQKLVFLKYEPGEFLEKGGDPFYLVKDNLSENKIIFGETLRREDKFPKDSGKLVDFYFQIKEEGQFNFSFGQGTLSNWDTVRQDLDKIVWKNLEMEREETEEVVFNSGGGVANVLGGDYSPAIGSWAISAIVSLFIICWMLKKRRNKRGS